MLYSINIELKVKHFKNSDYILRCPLERAAKEQFPNAKLIQEGVNYLKIDSTSYSHDFYDFYQFQKDLHNAIRNCANPELIIRSFKCERETVG